METMVLEKFVFNAEKAFEKDEFLEGMTFLEEALAIEPHYNKAHNHMGWLYLHKINNHEKAEMHLRLALKDGNVYGPAYIHLAYKLFDKRQFSELSELLSKALDVGGVDNSFVFNEFGRINEVKGHFRKAINNYKKALSNSFDDKEIKMIKDNIHRCRQKRWMLYF